METQRVLEARNGQIILERKCISRYSNKQRILLVGEGDFSLSSCLATAFGVATNMVATSLDSRGVLLQKYGMEAKFNTFNLSQRGALVFHDFDACKMATQHNLLLYFHYIIFNFPHAGFQWGREDNAYVIEKHKELVRLFFANARHMLLPGGQVHVSHKLGHPYDEWKLEEQARVGGLRLVERVPFHREHFPGYRNRRGDGSRAVESFNLGRADTYIFAAARFEEPPASSLNVRKPLRMSSTMLAHLQSLKEKAVSKAGASQETSLQQVIADEVARLEMLPRLSKKKMKTLENLKLALHQMNLENYPTSLSCTTNEPPATTLNVGEPVGIPSSTITMLAHVKSLKQKAVHKAGASQGTSLQQVVADEVTRLEKLELGKKEMKTLETLKSALQQMNLANCQGSLAAFAKNLGGSLEQHSKIIEMDMASLSNSTDMKWTSQNIGCTESTLPPFSPQTKLQDMDRVSQMNPNEVLVLGREETSKSDLTLDSSLGLSKESAGTISTVDKIEEEIEEDCTSSKQKSPLLETQLVTPLQRNVSCTAVDQHANSALNVGHDPVGLNSTILAHLKSLKEKAILKARASQVTPLQQVVADEVARLQKLKEEEKLGKKKMKTLETLKSALTQMNLENFQFVEASMERRAEDIGIALEEENGVIIDMDRVSQINPNEVLVVGREETSKSHLTLDSSLGLSQGSAGTISTVDKVEEEIKEDCTSSKQKSPLLEIQLVAPLQRNVSCAAGDQHVNSALNVGHDPVGMSSTMLAHLKSLKEKAILKAGASQVTPLQEVVADEVARLQKLKEEEKLGKKKMKTLETLKSALTQMNLENFQFVEASMERRAEDIGIALEEENGVIIDMDRVSQINPNEVLAVGREETSKSHLTLDSSLGLSQGSAGTISTVDKVEEEIKEDCTSSKQKSPLLEIQLVAPLQRNVSCAAGDQHVNSALNVGHDPVGMSSTMLAHLKSLKEKAILKAGASQVTPLQEVVADEVARLQKLKEEEKLGKKKMKTLETLKSALTQMNLENFQFVEASMERRAEDIGIALEEENGVIIDMDRVSQINPNEVLAVGREETSKSHLTLDSSLGLSQGSAGTISTVDKVEEEIKEDCTSSKQKSPLLEIQLVAPLQRNVSCAAGDQHVNSALNVGHDPVGMSSTILAHLKSLKQAIRKARASQVNPLQQQVVADEVARLEELKEEEKLGKKKMKTLEILKLALQQTNLDNFQLVEASVEALVEDLGIYLEEETEEIIDMGMAVSASLSNVADVEWGSQSSGCTKSLSSETVDLSFQDNPGNQVSENAEDTTKSHDILEPSPQFSKVSAETISTVDTVEEDIKVDCPSSKQEFRSLSGIQLMDDVAALRRKKNLESSDMEESSGLDEESVGCLTLLHNLWEILCRHLRKVSG